MNLRHITYQSLLFLLAFALGLGLRLYKLGDSPLSESEATWAVQALQIAHPNSTAGPLDLGPQPAYIFLTAATFSLFDSNAFTARLWPALAGSLLVFLPYILRRDLRHGVAMIMAFGLALDPGLVTVSRQAGGTMMALSFALLALALWRQRKSLLAGISGGIALLSGPTILSGALSLGLTWLATRLRRPRPMAYEDTQGNEKAEGSLSDPDQRLALLALTGTIVLLGSSFLRHPEGLAAWFSTLTTYLEGWGKPSAVPASRLLIGLPIFLPFIVFAIVYWLRWLLSETIHAIPAPDRVTVFLNFVTLGLPLIVLRAARSWSARLILWVIASLLVVVLYPGRQMADLVWVLAPLWFLIAAELANYLPVGKLDYIAPLQAGLILILATLFWNTLIATNQVIPVAGLPWTGIRVSLLIGILALGVLTTALVALGWSWESSRDGLVWGTSLVFTIYSIAAMWGAAQLRPNQPQELWGTQPGSGHAQLLTSSLQDLSTWNTGFSNMVNTVCTVDTASMRWLLRNYPNARFISEPPVGELPDIIITRQEGETPALTAAYRGQDFVWWVYQGWQGAYPPGFTNWLTFRQAPIVKEQIILWARSDLFPGGEVELEAIPDTTP